MGLKGVFFCFVLFPLLCCMIPRGEQRHCTIGLALEFRYSTGTSMDHEK